MLVPHFHVTSEANRSSIERFGLDWSHMGRARGIAGSGSPEVAGVFLVDNDDEVEWFIKMNGTGGPVDVWEVAGVDEDKLLMFHTGYLFYPGVIPPSQLTLLVSPGGHESDTAE